MKAGDQVRVRGENQDGQRVWMAFPFKLIGIRTSSDGAPSKYVVTGPSGGGLKRLVAPEDIKPFKWGDR